MMGRLRRYSKQTSSETYENPSTVFSSIEQTNSLDVERWGCSVRLYKLSYLLAIYFRSRCHMSLLGILYYWNERFLSLVYLKRDTCKWLSVGRQRLCIIIENVFYFENSEWIIWNLNIEECCCRLVIVDSHSRTTNSVWRESNFIISSLCRSLASLSFGLVHAFGFKVL
jgi:hypothetical protein